LPDFSTASDLPLAQLLTVTEPRGTFGRAIRKAQMEALYRLGPAILAAQLIAAVLMVASLADSVPLRPMLIWLGAVAVMCIWRGSRALRLRLDREYARRRPPDARAITTVSFAFGAIWWVPAVAFFDIADTPDKIILLLLAVGLVSAASFTMVTVPLAALVQIAMISASAIFMETHFHEPLLALTMLIYAAVMSGAVIVHARDFVRHIRQRLQLQEQSDLLSLLQELNTSGSGGLWELDADLRMVKLSPELAAAITRPVTDLIGRTVYGILDPAGRIAEVSEGMRILFGLLEEGTEFRDLAVPASSGRWWSLSGKPVIDSDGAIIGWRGVASDVTARRLEGGDAVRAARTDPLTGVANRLLVRELLEEALLGYAAGTAGCALLLVDLDRFKLVNDTLGHAVGDQLLCEVARRLEAAVAGGGSVGRLGGDEFAVIWTGDSDDESLGSLARQLIEALSKAFTVGAVTIHVGATIGIARAMRDGARQEQLMRSADLALYRAKQEGRGGFAFFDHSMFVAAEDLRALENDVREALDSGALRLVYQPIVDAKTGDLVSREALLRWNHPTRGEISPQRFVPIIEDAGLIHRIGDWVIRGACAEAASWDEPLRIAVNVSAAQLSGAGLAQTVVGALAASGLAPDRLELEVTESVFLGDDAATLKSLDGLRKLGVRLVLDDFGKGYSSFGYLARACFSKIKIDQTFVRGAAEGARESVAIVHAILALARGLGMDTTAEGIETAAQAKVLRDLGCTQLQGYYFGRPVPGEGWSRRHPARRRA
jgi:diguanylate cyclase (GGDEF)-like protein